MDRLDRDKLAAILSRNWWLLLLRGLVAILFGLLAYLQPGLSLASLVLFFGAYSLADGVIGVFSASAGRVEREHRWVLLLEGLVGIGVGVFTLFGPGVAALTLLFYIAIWAIATGLLEIVAAIRLRKEIKGEWLLISGGLVSVAFGGLLMAQPEAGALAVLWLIATYAVVFGLLLVALALKARGFSRRLMVPSEAP